MPHEMTQDNEARSIESVNRTRVERLDRSLPLENFVFPGEGALR